MVMRAKRIRWQGLDKNNIPVDTHGQSPWHFEIFKLCLTPFGRVLIHPRAKTVEPCPSGFWKVIGFLTNRWFRRRLKIANT